MKREKKEKKTLQSVFFKFVKNENYYEMKLLFEMYFYEKIIILGFEKKNI